MALNFRKVVNFIRKSLILGKEAQDHLVYHKSHLYFHVGKSQGLSLTISGPPLERTQLLSIIERRFGPPKISDYSRHGIAHFLYFLPEHDPWEIVLELKKTILCANCQKLELTLEEEQVAYDILAIAEKKLPHAWRKKKICQILSKLPREKRHKICQALTNYFKHKPHLTRRLQIAIN